MDMHRSNLDVVLLPPLVKEGCRRTLVVAEEPKVGMLGDAIFGESRHVGLQTNGGILVIFVKVQACIAPFKRLPPGDTQYV